MITDHGFLFVKASQSDTDAKRFTSYHEGYDVDWDDFQFADVVIAEYPDGSGYVWKNRWGRSSRTIDAGALALIRRAGGHAPVSSIDSRPRRRPSR